jgi:micrococcal nuclease
VPLTTRILQIIRSWLRRIGRADPIGKIAWGCLPVLALSILCILLAIVIQTGGLIAPSQPQANTSVFDRTTAAQPRQPNVSSPAAIADYPERPAELPQATVERVVDGDTVDVNLKGERVRLRLIGMNTPETVDPRRPVECYGREASAKARELLEGQTVWLEDDPSQQQRDRYKRFLAYIWMADGQMYNLEMIGQGYAYEYTYSVPYKYQSLFKRAEEAAREENRGLWAPWTCDGQRTATDPESTSEEVNQPTPSLQVEVPAANAASHPCQDGQIKGNRNSGIYHAPGQRHYADTRNNVECFDTEVEAQNAGYRRAQR